MSAKVSLYAPVRLGSHRYLFFVVGWNDYSTSLKEELAKQLEAFGADLGTSGLVLQPYKVHEYATYEEVRSKEWPAEFLERLESEIDPCMLVVENDFETFEPLAHRWAVIWFSDLQLYSADLAHLFHKLALISRANEDLLQYLKKVVLASQLKQTASSDRFTKYFEFGKPEVFGVSIDVKAILTDAVGFVADRMVPK